MKKNLKIKDIQIEEIIYFDDDLSPSEKEKCFEFCKSRKIDSLPSIINPSNFYLLDYEKGEFHKEILNDDRKLDGEFNIFKKAILDKFEKFPLQLVIDNYEITGVVHFSDYNNIKISEYLYTLFHEFERELRKTLVISKLSDDDMILYFEEKIKKEKYKIEYGRKLENYRKKKETSFQQPVFQGFELNDLISLIHNRKIWDINNSSEIVNLRNSIMHAKDFVLENSEIESSLLYNFDTFKMFFLKASYTINEYKRLLNFNNWRKDLGVGNVNL
jgi:hypothetical protein